MLIWRLILPFLVTLLFDYGWAFGLPLAYAPSPNLAGGGIVAKLGLALGSGAAVTYLWPLQWSSHRCWGVCVCML